MAMQSATDGSASFQALALLALSLVCCTAIANPGTVGTHDGKSYHGDIAIVPGGFQIKQPNHTNLVELSAVASLQIEKERRKDDPVVQAGLKGNGLWGAYFAQPDLSGPAIYRLDACLDFDWGDSWPAAGLPDDHFSVRWMGQLQVPRNGDYAFIAQSDDGVRLWINNELLIDNWKPNSGQELRSRLTLTTGKKYPFKLEFFEEEGSAMIRLSWEAPGLSRSIIPKECFSTSSPLATNAEAMADVPRSSWPHRRGVLLCNGSFIASGVESVSDDKLKLSHGPKGWELPLTQVARIHFRELTLEMNARVQEAQSGLLLGSHDFVEGEVKSVSRQRVQISSVLFGLRNIEIGGKVSAIVLRKPILSRTAFEVILRNGTDLRMDALECEKGHLTITAGIFQGWIIQPWELLAIRAAPPWPTAHR